MSCAMVAMVIILPVSGLSIFCSHFWPTLPVWYAFDVKTVDFI